MADLKISQLTSTANAATGDQLIINKGDATTQKIDISDFVQSLTAGGGDGGTDGLPESCHFSHSFFTFGVNYRGNLLNSLTSRESLVLIVIFEPQPAVTITMPPGANRAMCYSTAMVLLSMLQNLSLLVVTPKLWHSSSTT